MISPGVEPAAVSARRTAASIAVAAASPAGASALFPPPRRAASASASAASFPPPPHRYASSFLSTLFWPRGGRELLRLQTDRVRAAARLLQLGSVQPPPRSAPAVIDERLVVADAQDVRADAVRSRRLRDAGAVPARGGVRAVVVDERRRASRFARPGRSGRRRGGRRRHLRECRDFRSDVPRARRASLGGIKARPRGVASAWRSVLAPPPRAPRDEPRS